MPARQPPSSGDETLCKLGFIRIARVTAKRRYQLVHILPRKKRMLRFASSVEDKAGVLSRHKTAFLPAAAPAEEASPAKASRLSASCVRQASAFHLAKRSPPPPALFSSVFSCKEKTQRFVPLRSSYVGYTGFSPLQRSPCLQWRRQSGLRCPALPPLSESAPFAGASPDVWA